MAIIRKIVNIILYGKILYENLVICIKELLNANFAAVLPTGFVGETHIFVVLHLLFSRF